ncbi:protein UL30A [Aotine betaherpesvirus 1]|uniref:Protein UL30A n=1 Tax=Aotine betaherpesvirus 1 TaxID=50290 RepID=G8XUA5_9BETA|nr:protein UL30A [Aotine betaherpesvirus 1]AEV80736.1 protein UL30A [Aotine betaherpesvirus 1]
MAECGSEGTEQADLEKEKEVESLVEWARFLHLRVQWNLTPSVYMCDLKKFLRFYDELTPERQRLFESEVEMVERRARIQHMKNTHRRRASARLSVGG